jgi:hypothetical protein
MDERAGSSLRYDKLEEDEAKLEVAGDPNPNAEVGFAKAARLLLAWALNGRLLIVDGAKGIC